MYHLSAMSLLWLSIVQMLFDGFRWLGIFGLFCVTNIAEKRKCFRQICPQSHSIHLVCRVSMQGIHTKGVAFVLLPFLQVAKMGKHIATRTTSRNNQRFGIWKFQLLFFGGKTLARVAASSDDLLFCDGMLS